MSAQPDMPSAGADPLVSVVMPAFNSSQTIESAIDSVLAQDYPHLQLIVVDDGSTDGTPDRVLARYGARVSLHSQMNRGPAAARNVGLKAAQGKYVAFLDADDIWLPGKVRRQVAYLDQHPGVEAVFGRFVRWEANAAGQFAAPAGVDAEPAPVKERLTSPSGQIYADLLLDSAVHIITAMVRRSVFDDIGRFDEGLATGEDYDFWLRLAWGHRIDQLDAVLAWYRIHPGSLTKIPRAESDEYRVLCRTLERHGSIGQDGRAVDRATLDRRLAAICFGHGYLHFWRGSALHAQRAFARCLRHAPWQPKVLAYWLLAGLRRLTRPT